jgi:hypothetical protein
MKVLTRWSLTCGVVVSLAVTVVGGPVAANPDVRSASPTQAGSKPLASSAVEPMTAGQRIKNGDGDAAGKCLDIEGAGASNQVDVWHCNGGAWQNWNYRGRPDIQNGVYEIRSRQTRPLADYCVTASSFGNGTQVFLSNCNNFGTLWVVHPVSGASGWNQWENYDFPGQCLDVRDFGKSNVVQQWDCNFSNPATRGNQMWMVF